jgi:hypothetical protein
LENGPADLPIGLFDGTSIFGHYQGSLYDVAIVPTDQRRNTCDSMSVAVFYYHVLNENCLATLESARSLICGDAADARYSLFDIQNVDPTRVTASVSATSPDYAQ